MEPLPLVFLAALYMVVGQPKIQVAGAPLEGLSTYKGC